MPELKYKATAEEQVKIIDLAEIECQRILDLKLNKLYYRNKPPFPVLDIEDPDREKPRVSVGAAKDVVKKRASFLFGEDKFEGPNSIEFEDAKFGDSVWKIWDWNGLSGKIVSFAQDLYWAGFAAWKIVIQPTVEKKPLRFNRVKPETLYCEFNPGEDQTKDSVRVWIIMFRRDDSTFYREEIYKDHILYYEGALATDLELKEFKGDQADPDSPHVKFILKRVEDNDLGLFTIAFVARDDEDSIWGTCLFQDVRSRIDRLNEVYTNAMFATAKVADPVVWLTGVKDVQGLQKDSDAVWFLENPDASVNILQWVGVPESTITLIKQLVDQIYHECDLPLILRNSDQSIGDIPSRSLKILYTDLEGAVQKDRAILNDWFFDVFNLIWKALEVTKGLGKKLAAGTSFNFEKINWGSIIPVDEKAEQESVLAIYNAGLYDPMTTLVKLGHGEEDAAAILAKVKKYAAEKFGDIVPNDTGDDSLDMTDEDNLDTEEA